MAFPKNAGSYLPAAWWRQDASKSFIPKDRENINGKTEALIEVRCFLGFSRLDAFSRGCCI